MGDTVNDQGGYVGGDVAPADLWGAAPGRGRACEVLEKVLVGHGVDKVEAFELVDALIDAGLCPTGEERGGSGFSGLSSVQLQPDPPLWCMVVYEPGGGPPVAVHGPYTDVRLAIRDAKVRNTQRTRPPGTLLASLARLEPPTP